MLQINSGKLYPNGVGRTNNLRGVLYSNLVLAGLDDAPIVTAAGTLREVGPFRSPRPIVYELAEQMDTGLRAPGVLVSHGVQPYLHDFAAVASFVLRCICTPDPDLCERLLSGNRSLAVATPPNKLVRRVFDKDLWVQPAEAQALTSFVADLIGLKRKSFLAVMQAIRTYVTGLHRVVDDLELAYTLLVASIESLAQDFDGHEGRWSDYEEAKRRRMDRALADADDITAERVRAALIKIEHLALSRRFRDFALDHISDEVLREPGRTAAPGRLDLRDALKEAYGLRSRYVHNLRDLPRLLDSDFAYRETLRHGHVTYLTIEGLSRVARAVILEFVIRQPKVETEVYDYHLERHGVIQAQLAPEYWIGNAQLLQPDSGHQWLESFLFQFAGHLFNKTPLTELSAICTKIEDMLPQLKLEQRTALMALYCLYNGIVPVESRSARYKEVIRANHDVLAAPSVESLAVHLLHDRVPPWPLPEHKALLDTYFGQCNHKSGFRAPEIFEAGFILSLAERYRQAHALDEAKALLSFAAQNAFHFPGVLTIEEQFDPAVPIDWGELVPGRDARKMETVQTDTVQTDTGQTNVYTESAPAIEIPSDDASAAGPQEPLSEQPPVAPETAADPKASPGNLSVEAEQSPSEQPL